MRADGAPHEGDGAAEPHVAWPPCGAGAAGWSQLGPGTGAAAGAAAGASGGWGGAATTVDAIDPGRGAETVGAHVATACPGVAASAVVAAAAPRAGADGRTAFLLFFPPPPPFFTRLRRTNRYMTPAASATTARIISAYSIGIRWRASLWAVS